MNQGKGETGKETEKQLKPSQRHEVLCAHLNSAPCSSDSVEDDIPTVVLCSSAHHRRACQTSLAKETPDSLLLISMGQWEMHGEPIGEEFSPLDLKSSHASECREGDMIRQWSLSILSKN